MKRFFDAFLRENPQAMRETPKVRYFQLGENQWHTSDAWPPRESRETPLYLTSSGALADAPPAGGAAVRTYRYDPARPYPSDVTDGMGRKLLADRRELLNREDALAFLGPVQTAPLRLAGRPRLELYASSSAVDTDFCCVVSDMSPEGRVRQLTCGMVRARFRDGAAPRLLVPDRCEAFSVGLGHIAHTLLPGHRLLVTVTSSLYPLHDANLNEGLPAGHGTRPLVAEQRVYADRLHPSRIVLPVMGGGTASSPVAAQ